MPNFNTLTGKDLDIAVAKCLGLQVAKVYGRGAVVFEYGLWKTLPNGGFQNYVLVDDYAKMLKQCDGPCLHRDTLIWSPSTIHDQAGPIMDKEFISVTIGDWDVDDTPIVSSWAARSLHDEIYAASDAGWYTGPTRLIAAMRCYVASKEDQDG